MFQQAMSYLLSFDSLVALLFGVVGGMFIGAMPGLGATMGIALLIPVTFGMEPVPALIMLTTIYTAATYGGSFTAILIHTPGTPSNMATCLDGYAMTQQGKGLRAIGISTAASVTGGVISAIVLILIAPLLAKAALKFDAIEYFLIAIFGLSIIGSLSGDSMVKGVLAGVLGLLAGCVGVDATYGVLRFTFGVTSLTSGVSLTPAIIGLFSISQVMILAEKIRKKGDTAERAETPIMKGRALPTLKEYVKMLPNIIRSAIIGVGVGILPGAGGDIGGWLSYNEAKRFSKNKEQFGRGSEEGLCASEAANNAVTGGSYIPLFTLGIPGSATASVLMGGLIIQGLNPGTEMFTTYAPLTYAIFGGFLIANLIMGFIGILIAKYIVKAAYVSTAILAPIIVVLSVVGAYAINVNLFDVVMMAIFGIFGYLLRKNGFATAPFILGLILGPMAERQLQRAFLMSKGASIIQYTFARPLAVVLLVMIVIALFAPLIGKLLSRKLAVRNAATAEQAERFKDSDD